MTSSMSDSAELPEPESLNVRGWKRIGSLLQWQTVPGKFLVILLLIFLVKGVFFAFVFPPFSGHDEVMHYAYLKIVAEDGRIPVIPDLDEWRATGNLTDPLFDHAPVELFEYANKGSNQKKSFTTADWYGDYPEPIWAVRVAGLSFPAGWIYTANHPPLFYLVMTPLYWMVQHLDLDLQLYAIRLATIPFGMITVLFAFLTVRVLFPRDRFLAITVPAFIAFQPQISYEAAMLNNDIFAIAFTSVVFYLLAVGLKRHFTWKICILTGCVFGLAMLSKNTSVTSGMVIAIAMILGCGWRDYREWIPKGATVAGVAGLLIWPWYVYMYRTYGDFTAMSRIKALQWWNYGGGPGRTVWNQLTDPVFAWDRWNETWGDFGWRLIRLDPELMWILLYVCLIGVIGLGWWILQVALVSRGKMIVFRHEGGRLTLPAVTMLDGSNEPGRVDPIFDTDRGTKIAVVTLVAAFVIAYYAILQFGTQFSLTQARYYFPTFNAFALLVMLGYRALTPRSWVPYVASAFIIGWVVLNIVIFTNNVLPYWYPNAW